MGNRERFVSSRVEDYKFWNGDERDERKSTKIETRKEICEGDQSSGRNFWRSKFLILKNHLYFLSILDGFKR